MKGPWRNRLRKALTERDGDHCFYCNLPLGDDASIEHLVARSHGGPKHLSNFVLAHTACNRRADHLSVAEKVRLREALQRQPEEAAA